MLKTLSGIASVLRSTQYAVSTSHVNRSAFQPERTVTQSAALRPRKPSPDQPLNTMRTAALLVAATTVRALRPAMPSLYQRRAPVVNLLDAKGQSIAPVTPAGGGASDKDHDVLLGELIFSSRDPREDVASAPELYTEDFLKFVSDKAEDSDDMEEREGLKSLVDMIRSTLAIVEKMTKEAEEAQARIEAEVEAEAERAKALARGEVVVDTEQVLGAAAVASGIEQYAEMAREARSEGPGEAGLYGDALRTYDALLSELVQAEAKGELAVSGSMLLLSLRFGMKKDLAALRTQMKEQQKAMARRITSHHSIYFFERRGRLFLAWPGVGLLLAARRSSPWNHAFSPTLAQRPRWLILNKTDLVDEATLSQSRDRIVEAIGWSGPIYSVSAVAGRGTERLCGDLMTFLEAQQAFFRDDPEAAAKERLAQEQALNYARLRLTHLRHRPGPGTGRSTGRVVFVPFYFCVDALMDELPGSESRFDPGASPHT